ncbi:hypothetical protein VC83_05169 [Pseudogymnoascus destructans]|uniref:Uncharacterized protein n=1 Tax=Pseudogymnoascus destructans TaxID=655981 RepID=A0A177ABX1_9PEZI|nr:uncharacterized protein VC83_05169 [Pseudogymnoascus destructans]OAF58683.1 hypothetical protein VC83_05169 [Pseudogymnoascus destructans]
MAEDDTQATLAPPSPPSQAIEDPGAHELESSDSDDHFSDARSDRAAYSRTASPIPTTRVERVDHEASYGEVPGTAAYDQRSEDARPDEVAFVEKKSSSATDPVPRLLTPIPQTVLEEAPPSPIRGHAHKPSTPKVYPADAQPDRIIHTPDSGATSAEEEGGDVSGTRPRSPTSPSAPKSETRSRTSSAARPPSVSHALPPPGGDYDADADGDEDDEDAGFGDDFDDFEEGDEDAEFGDFDDGFQEAGAQPVQSLPQIASLSLPPLSFDTLDSPAEVHAATTPYLDTLFPPSPPAVTTAPPTSLFPTPRSASLWAQLSAPPPLNPPNWLRSRIRRLFLVSLGVPIDLDEILPASKQAKLILPSTASPRTSSDARLGSVARLQGDSNGSSASVDSSGKSKRRRGPPPAPALDLGAARRLCSTTDEALTGLRDAELKEHVEVLEGLRGAAEGVLEYWTRRTDEKLGDREAFEGVIENLVQHARKVRK